MSRPPADLEARIRAYREQQQARLNAGPLGRRGTTNRRLAEWHFDGQAFYLPETVDRQRAGEAASD